MSCVRERFALYAWGQGACVESPCGIESRSPTKLCDLVGSRGPSSQLQFVVQLTENLAMQNEINIIENPDKYNGNFKPLT